VEPHGLAPIDNQGGKKSVEPAGNTVLCLVHQAGLKRALLFRYEIYSRNRLFSTGRRRRGTEEDLARKHRGRNSKHEKEYLRERAKTFPYAMRSLIRPTTYRHTQTRATMEKGTR